MYNTYRIIIINNWSNYKKKNGVLCVNCYEKNCDYEKVNRDFPKCVWLGVEGDFSLFFMRHRGPPVRILFSTCPAGWVRRNSDLLRVCFSVGR